MMNLVSGTPGTGSRQTSRGRRLPASLCTDPVIGDILAGWRYDISGLSPAMRTDYDQHLTECTCCRRRQHRSRMVDVLLISVTSLSILAFLLAAAVIHKIEAVTHVGNLHVHLRQMPITISLEAVAIAGLAVSLILWILVAIATPLPGFLGGIVQERIPPQLRDRISKNAA